MLYNQQKTDKRPNVLFKERGKAELSSSFLRRYGDLKYVLNCRHNLFVCGSRPQQNFHWFLNMKQFIKTKEAGFALDTFYKQQFSHLSGLRPVMRCQHCSQSSPLQCVTLAPVMKSAALGEMIAVGQCRLQPFWNHCLVSG